MHVSLSNESSETGRQAYNPISTFCFFFCCFPSIFLFSLEPLDLIISCMVRLNDICYGSPLDAKTMTCQDFSVEFCHLAGTIEKTWPNTHTYIGMLYRSTRSLCNILVRELMNVSNLLDECVKSVTTHVGHVHFTKPQNAIGPPNDPSMTWIGRENQHLGK